MFQRESKKYVFLAVEMFKNNIANNNNNIFVKTFEDE
jgi:hypothetical protein